MFTSDAGYVFRVDKAYVVRLVELKPAADQNQEALEIRGRYFTFEPIVAEPTPTELLQLGKWLKSSVLRGVAKLPGYAGNVG